MNRRPMPPLSGLSRRSVLASAALGLGGRLDRALAEEATPSARPVQFLWKSSGDPTFAHWYPVHIAVAPGGNIWVGDGDHNGFQIFAPDGTHLETWGETGSGDGQFDFNSFGMGGYRHGAVAFAPDGSYYVSDSGNRRIQRFGPDRKFVSAWGGEGMGPGQFITPIDLVVDAQGRVYVVDSYRGDPVYGDSTTGAVQVFDAGGHFLAAWGEHGAQPGQLSSPFGIGLDPNGTLLIAEIDNNRVQRFSPEGERLDGWGGYGIDNGEFLYAMDAAVDAEGQVFVTDFYNNRVQVFDRDGHFLAAWGGIGSNPRVFGATIGVAVGADGVVYVTDQGRLLQAFRVGVLPSPSAGTPTT